MTTFRKSALAGTLLSIVAIGSPAFADESIVQQDMTPIASQPGIGGRVLAWVNAGLPLTVLGRDGEWLRVASSQLGFAGQDLWVPAARLGTIDRSELQPGAQDLASSRVTAPGFRILVTAATATATAAGETNGGATARGATESKPASDLSRAASAPREKTAASTPATSPGSAAATTPSGTSTPSAAATAAGGLAPSTDNRIAGEGNPTPAMGNPAPAIGNSAPALGNPTPALGNPTSAVGNPVSSFGSSNLSTP